MRHVTAHPASTCAEEHNPEAPLVTDRSLDELGRNARQTIGEMAHGYYAGGSDDERLLRANVDRRARRQLQTELKRAMGLCGAGSVPAIDHSVVRWAPGWSFDGGRR